MYKHRSLRGSLTSRTREALFSVYGESRLPAISSNASPTEIHRWKALPSVKKCYNDLLKERDKAENNELSRILAKVFPNCKKIPELLVAYAISVC